MIPADYQIAKLAAMLYPIYLAEVSAEAVKEGYTHYIRSEVRRKAVREAIELETEVLRQRKEQGEGIG
jgi:hypothetical protein